MEIIVAIVLLAGAGFITYLALDAARHVKLAVNGQEIFKIEPLK